MVNLQNSHFNGIAQLEGRRIFIRALENNTKIKAKVEKGLDTPLTSGNKNIYF